MVSMISLVSLSKAVSVEWNFRYADWMGEKLGEVERWGRRRARAKRSNILPNVFKLEIGLEFEGSDLESPGFFRKGEICASLNFDGKVTWVKDKLAKRAMRTEKVSEHDFSKDVGMKPSGDDLPDIERSSFETSSGVTGVYSESRLWLWGWSKSKGEGGPFNPRTPRGGGGVGTTPPWRFSPITFLVIPTGKIASVYLILGIEDTFWHMWHHLDAVTWHMSWRQRSMTIDENTVVLPLYVYHDIFWSIRDKAIRLVLFLTFSRSGNSKMLQLVTWPWRMTLKIKVKLPWNWPFITRLLIMVERWSWCRFQHFHGRRSRINQIKLRDLDGWPWKSRSNMCTGMTFVISGCKHNTDLILVSILAFLRSGISKKLK